MEWRAEGWQISLNETIPVPLYYQLEEAIRENVLKGVWRAHTRLPSERVIAEELGVCRQTVRQALERLVRQGVLYRARGQGTFIAPPKVDEVIASRISGFFDEMRARGEQVETRVLLVESAEAAEWLVERLGLGPEERCTVYQRLRYVEGAPVAVITSYVREKMYPGLKSLITGERALYEVFRTDYGRPIVRVRRCLEAVAAPDPEAGFLGVRVGSPVMQVESVAYLRDGTPVEYQRRLHRGDRSRFELEIVMSEREIP